MSQAGIIRSTGSSPPPTITIVGNDQTNKDGFGTNVSGTSPNFTINSFGLLKFIVNPVAGLGTHTTIAAAMASATAGDYIGITEGTYTENITITPGVTVVGLGNNGFFAAASGAPRPNTTIVGVWTLSSGTAVISNLGLFDNANSIANISGGATLSLQNCFLSNLTSTFAFNLTGSISNLNIAKCYGRLGTSSNWFAQAGPICLVAIDGCNLTAPSGAGPGSTLNAGSFIQVHNSNVFDSFIMGSGGSSGAITIQNSTIASSGSTIVCNSTNNTNSISNSNIGNNGTSVAPIMIQNGANMRISASTINSSIATAITGSGTLIYSGLNFPGVGSIISSSIQTPKVASNDAVQIIVPPSYPYSIASQDALVLVNTLTAANTVNLPATPSDGEKHIIKDVSANATINNITIDGNGNNIVGTTSASTYLITLNGASITLVYSATVGVWGII